MKINEFLIERPLVTKLILMFLLILAVISAFKLKRQAYPRVDYQQMTIRTIYPGAAPEDVEVNVTIKLEEALKELDGIQKYTSISLENLSEITVYVDPDTEDKDKVKNEIRRVIDRVTDLPDEVDQKPMVEEEKVDNMPVYEIALSIPNGDTKLLNYHIKKLKKKLLEIKNVSKVEESGVRKREIKVLLNRKKMFQNAITFDEVISAIKNTKLRVSGGSVESYKSEKGIVTFSEFEKPEDIKNIIIRAGDIGGQKIRIEDVGTVVDDFEKENVFNKYNGKIGLSLWVVKKANADVITTIDEAKKVIDEYKKNSPEKNLEFFSTWDASIETKNRLFIVYSNAIVGFIFVLIILFLFLDRRIAFWTAFGIPVSIGITIMILPWLKITVNSVSLLGLVVVLGMVVDDAIIIAESIYSAREQGMNPKDASLYGLKSVIKPVIATIVTTIVAFMPLYFLPGLVGDFSVEIPSIVIIMLTASLIEASFMLPAHLAHTKDPNYKKVNIPPGQIFLNWVGDKYERLLTKAINHKYVSLLFLILFIIVGGAVTLLITKFQLFPMDQATEIWISGETSDNANLDYTLRETVKIEKVIEELPKGVVYSYKTNIGSRFNSLFTSNIYSSNFFYVKLTLTPATSRTMKALDVKDFVKKEIEKKYKESFPFIDFYIDSGGPPVGKPLEIRVTGNNNADRKKAINEIIADLKEFPLLEIDSDLKEGKEQLRILPKYDEISEAKLEVSSIASTIRTAFDGYVVTHLQTPEENVPYRIILDDESKDFNDPLKKLYVRNYFGNLIPIKTFVTEKVNYAIQNIYHYNGDRMNTITANIDINKATPKELYDKLKNRYTKLENKYQGIKIDLGGEAEESAKTFFHLMISLLIAIVAIYFILVMQFNSFGQPLMMILGIPFGLLGITLAFGLHRMDLSMLSMVGVIGFTGVIVNDSLVMVHFINEIRKKESTTDFTLNVVKGARLRLRPIILTSLTTVVALLPTAYGIIGGIDSFVSPMVMAMMWGLLVGTISTLIVIPVLYAIFEDIKKIFTFKKNVKNG